MEYGTWNTRPLSIPAQPSRGSAEATFDASSPRLASDVR
jgi:hypothetical protein